MNLVLILITSLFLHVGSGQDSLRHLDMNNKHLTEIPTEALERHPDLQMLSLASNDITKIGENSFDDVSRITYLNLYNNRLSTIERGAFPWSLRTLHLSYNNLSTLNGSLLHLRSLEYLSVVYNKLTSVRLELRRLTRLDRLDLAGNHITDFCREIRPLQNITKLILSDMGLTSLDHDCFKDMKVLEMVDLSQNSLTNIDAFTGHVFPNLLFLYFKGNQLQNFRNGLEKLKELFLLDISFNRFDKLEIQHFIHNTNLGGIKLEGNKWNCNDTLLWDNFTYLQSHEVKLIGLPLC